ncbi:MAG: DNA-directed RNA polymerase subunit H [archaeon]
MAKKIDVQNHIFVPKHIKMGEEDVQKLLEKYNINLKQLPRIIKTDPAIRDLDAKVGDVIKILRNSPIIGDVEFYRVVSNA